MSLQRSRRKNWRARKSAEGRHAICHQQSPEEHNYVLQGSSKWHRNSRSTIPVKHAAERQELVSPWQSWPALSRYSSPREIARPENFPSFTLSLSLSHLPLLLPWSNERGKIANVSARKYWETLHVLSYVAGNREMYGIRGGRKKKRTKKGREEQRKEEKRRVFIRGRRIGRGKTGWIDTRYCGVPPSAAASAVP